MGNNKKKDLSAKYKNGGDGMFFFHKKTGHPAKQLAHTTKTWTNTRYTHKPNRKKDYVVDKSLSTKNNPVFVTKHKFTDVIYTRGREYDMSQYNKSNLRKNKKR